MKWSEFKKMVEDAGVSDDMEVEWIDVVEGTVHRAEVRVVEVQEGKKTFIVD